MINTHLMNKPAVTVMRPLDRLGDLEIAECEAAACGFASDDASRIREAASGGGGILEMIAQGKTESLLLITTALTMRYNNTKTLSDRMSKIC